MDCVCQSQQNRRLARRVPSVSTASMLQDNTPAARALAGAGAHEVAFRRKI